MFDLAALGFAMGVPAPLTFTLVCVVALRHLDIAYRARDPLGSRPRFAGAGLGWEGRMLAAGVAALLGAVTFACDLICAESPTAATRPSRTSMAPGA